MGHFSETFHFIKMNLNVTTAILFCSMLGLASCFECPSDGVFADPDNCQCYWDCANLDPFHMCCGQDTLFSARLLVCDFAFAVDCGDRPLPGSTRPPTPTTTKPTTTTQTTTTTTSTTPTTTTTTTPGECSEFSDSKTCAITEYTVEGFKHRESAAACQELCRTLQTCLYFTWYDGGCYLLNSCEDVAPCDCCVSGTEFPDVVSCDVGCSAL